MRMRLYLEQAYIPRPGPLALSILKAQQVTTNGVYRLRINCNIRTNSATHSMRVLGACGDLG